MAYAQVANTLPLVQAQDARTAQPEALVTTMLMLP
jgi:hypothetical protein